MNTHSDPLLDQYADLDFSQAKPVAEVPALAKLQATQGDKTRDKTRIRMGLDTAIIPTIREEPHRT